MARLPEFQRHLKTDYNPQALQKYAKTNKADVIAEYQRLRKIVLKRVERFGWSKNPKELSSGEFLLTKPSVIGRSLSKKLKPSRDLGVRAMSARITEMTHFLEMRGSTIKGAREIRRETREHLEETLEYKFKNFREFELFTQFMDYIRALYKDNFHYLMDDITDLFSDYSSEVLNKSMSFDEFVTLYQTKYRREPQELKRPTNFR